METTHAEESLSEREHKQRHINVGGTERKASMVGGAALALTGLRSMTKKHFLPGLAMMAAGGMFLYRGKTGHCDLYEKMGVDTTVSETGVNIEKIVTINRPRQQVYDFWRNMENLPSFMQHLESVQVTSEGRSHWKARGPAGMTVEWDAETIDEVPGQRISWRSVGDTQFPNRGSVLFSDAPGDRGTEVRVSVEFTPPGGAAGRVAAKMTRMITAQQLEEDLKRLKQILETGEIARAERTLH
jgi:uncharacterized membrane protein